MFAILKYRKKCAEEGGSYVKRSEHVMNFKNEILAEKTIEKSKKLCECEFVTLEIKQRKGRQVISIHFFFSFFFIV